jgi:hypothetical protein
MELAERRNGPVRVDPISHVHRKGLLSQLDVPLGGNSPKPGSRLKQDKRK